MTRVAAVCSVRRVTVAEFLLKLAQDPECFARFKKDPPAVLEEHGLSPSQAGLLLAGDLRKLRVTLEFELDVEGEYIAMRTICGPQPPPPPPPPSPPRTPVGE